MHTDLIWQVIREIILKATRTLGACIVYGVLAKTMPSLSVWSPCVEKSQEICWP